MRASAWLLLAVVLVAAQATAGRELLDDEVTAAIRNMNPKTRNAPKGKYPWVVALFYNSKVVSPIGMKYGQLFCQGALIAPDVVLTAASCFYTRDMSIVPGRIFPFLRVGAWGSNGFATTNGEFANVTIYAYHKRYNFGDNKPAFDLALLQLDRNITSALPVRLPPYSRLDPLKGGISWRNATMLSMVGWGPTEGPAGDWKNGRMAKNLMWTNTLKASREQCMAEWPGLPSLKVGQTMCARYFGHGKNACYDEGLPGDGGSPVFVERKGRQDLLVGVNNIGRCNRLKPNIMQSVSHFRLWIDLGLYLLKNPTKFSGDYPFWAFVKSQFEVWE